MAEGGNFSRSIDGSDIVYEFVCTPCAGDGSRLEAFHFCQTCDQFLCDTCTKYHQRYTKSHQLQQAGSVKHKKRQTVTTKQLDAPKCHIHPDRDVEMYCGTHDMVYCLLCIAKEHRSCNNVDEVQDGVHKPNISTLQQLVSDIDRVTNELHKIKQNKSDSLKQIKTKKTDILKKIDKARKEINDHLDQLEHEIKSELDEEITKLEQDIKDDIDAADDLLTMANETKTDHTRNDGDKHLFIAEKLGRKVLSDVNAFVTNVTSSDLDNIGFKQDQRLYDDIMRADSIGKIVRSPSIQQHITRRQYVLKSFNQNNVKVDADREDCFISGMCQVQNGTILLVDNTNCKLKRLDDQLIVKDFCCLKSKPVGLCAISSSEVIVRYFNSIQFINVDHTLSLGKTIQINPLKVCYGNSIAFCKDRIWTFGDTCTCIHVYSLSGTSMKTIETVLHGQTDSIAANKDEGKVYVTTFGDDNVIVFNSNGDVISKLRDQRLTRPGGICVTDDDIVFVFGKVSRNVLMFGSDGNSIGELVQRKDIPTAQRSLCFDRKKHRLLLGNISNKMQTFQLSK